MLMLYPLYPLLCQPSFLASFSPFFYKEQEEPMTLLIYSGLLYLAGVAIILYVRPELMFNQEGEWKEFGLGRHRDRYTWLPFWLFAILWAILSYLIVLTICAPAPAIPTPTSSLAPENVSLKSLASSVKKKPTNAEEMKKGYYILDVQETTKKGIPKYIYLGPEAPNLMFHDQTADSE